MIAGRNDNRVAAAPAWLEPLAATGGDRSGSSPARAERTAQLPRAHINPSGRKEG
jgi:hypothetical protein